MFSTMRVYHLIVISAVVGITLVVPSTLTTRFGRAQTLPPPSANVSVFASGLNNPRGLKWGPDGNLYVAEGGTGGKYSTAGTCTQVPAVPGPGPDTGSQTGSGVSMITPTGKLTRITSSLPSSQTSPGTGSSVSGVSDVAFVGGKMYGLLSGAGCSHGVIGVPNGVVQINTDGSWSLVANLSAFLAANPVKSPEATDFEPDGTPYSLLAIDNLLYVIEPNHGEFDRVDPTTGTITRIVDISASQGHLVPTAMDYNTGNFYVGNLGGFPIIPGTQKILKITPSGDISVAATGLTFVLGVAFDRSGRMYALESATKPGFPDPSNLGTGMVVRVTASGSLETIATGLTFPTGMTFGPDGNLYVSNLGYNIPALGAGQIVKIMVPQGTTLSATPVFRSPRRPSLSWPD